MKKLDVDQMMDIFYITESIKHFEQARDLLQDVEGVVYASKMMKLATGQLGEAVYTLLKDFDKDEFKYHVKRIKKIYEGESDGCIRSD